jgi:hypothetical protein
MDSLRISGNILDYTYGQKSRARLDEIVEGNIVWTK